MKQVRTHLGWLTSARSLRLVSFLLAMVTSFSLSYATILFIESQTNDAQAQTTPQVIEVVEEVTPKEEEQVAEPVQTETPVPAPAPAPTPPARAAAPAPAYDKVSIPSIGLSSRFVTVGTTATNAIDVHPSLVGWWVGSAMIGTPGAAFLDGHNPGIFSKLPNIQVGAQITVAKASGETFNYTVVERETVQLVGINMRKALSVQGGATEGLNLMTCVGAYNSQTGTTDQRLVVYAVRS